MIFVMFTVYLAILKKQLVSKTLVIHHVLIFNPSYILLNRNMSIKKALDGTQEYKYIQYMQSKFTQVMNISC